MICTEKYDGNVSSSPVRYKFAATPDAVTGISFKCALIIKITVFTLSLDPGTFHIIVTPGLIVTFLTIGFHILLFLATKLWKCYEPYYKFSLATLQHTHGFANNNVNWSMKSFINVFPNLAIGIKSESQSIRNIVIVCGASVLRPWCLMSGLMATLEALGSFMHQMSLLMGNNIKTL